MKKHRAVIFDLDGTLVNSLEDIADSVNRSLAQLGFPKHDVEAFKIFTGDGREVMANRALPREHRDETTTKKLVGLIDVEYSKCWSNKTRPYAGIPELLDELTAKRIKLAVLSNKDQHFTELMVSKLLNRWHFEAVAGILPGGVKKPEPEGAFKIARQFQLEPSEFAFVGDTDVDMKTATAAGMFPVGALWGFRSHEELVKGGAKSVIEHPSELLHLQ